MLIVLLFQVLVLSARAYTDMFELYDEISRENVLNETFFSSLESYQVGALTVDETQYPWIARVVHSQSGYKPHMCTAVCIEKRIFITAARCIYSLKVNYTTILYQQRRLPALAFVVPSNTSKQAFDDIGFIVTEQARGRWDTVKLFDDTNRTDDNFDWFAKLDLTNGNYSVVGYATRKGIHRIKSPDLTFNLTMLNVTIDLQICTTILTFYNRVRGFHVPCYHSCSLKQFINKEKQCKKYHGVEGGAVYDRETNKLIGIATWGPYFYKYELPVGFSVPNTKNFFEDYQCAKHIRNDYSMLVMGGYYQSICNV